MTLSRLARTYRAGALVGDQATANDAERLARSGAPVREITTAAECRLDAEMITRALVDWPPGPLDVLFVENVGNLICPAEYDLGEDLRLVLFSVTEGEDKPLKYPLAFNTAHVTILTKLDIAAAVEFDRTAAISSIHAVTRNANTRTPARTGAGMEGWFALIEERIRAKTMATAG